MPRLRHDAPFEQGLEVLHGPTVQGERRERGEGGEKREREM